MNEHLEAMLIRAKKWNQEEPRVASDASDASDASAASGAIVERCWSYWIGLIVLVVCCQAARLPGYHAGTMS